MATTRIADWVLASGDMSASTLLTRGATGREAKVVGEYGRPFSTLGISVRVIAG
jgi:hypothetical protein